MHIVFCTSFSLYTHTHHGRVLTTLDLHVQILDACSIVQVFDETVHIARSLGPLPFILVFLPLLIPVPIFFLIHAYQIHSLFQCFLYDIMRGCLYEILQ